MDVYVQKCFGGTYRLLITTRRSPYFGKRYVVYGDSYGDWTRDVASRAKRIIAVETGADTKNIRFTHHYLNFINDGNRHNTTTQGV